MTTLSELRNAGFFVDLKNDGNLSITPLKTSCGFTEALRRSIELNKDKIIAQLLSENNIAKTCSTCNTAKNIKLFYANKSKSNGVDGVCKACDKKRKNLNKLIKTMNQTKIDEVYNKFPPVTRSLFDSIPRSEPWPQDKIEAELYRNKKLRPCQQVVALALNNLVSSGIVTEPKRGMYMQTKIAVKNGLKEVKNVDLQLMLLELSGKIEKQTQLRVAADIDFKAAMAKLFDFRFDAVSASNKHFQSLLDELEALSVIADVESKKVVEVDPELVRKAALYDVIKGAMS